MSRIEELFARIQRAHKWAPPLPGAERRSLEAQLSLPLPDDWREFFSLCNGARIGGEHGYCDYNFVPMEEVRRTRIDVFGQDLDYDNDATLYWVSVCDVGDSNHVSAALESVKGSFCWMLDSDHETYGDGDIIAVSFSDFLEGTLGADEPSFWLLTHPNFGTAPDHNARQADLSLPDVRRAAFPYLEG